MFDRCLLNRGFGTNNRLTASLGPRDSLSIHLGEDRFTANTVIAVQSRALKVAFRSSGLSSLMLG